MSISIHVPIGTITVSGNLCPQDGVYKTKYSSRRYICRRGKFMPRPKGKDYLLELESYLC
jgi:hypothetical protein